MTRYHTFQLLVDFGGLAKHIEVLAVDIDAAKADIEQGYHEARVVQWQQR